MSKTNFPDNYEIYDFGGVMNLKQVVLHRMKPERYVSHKWGFRFFPKGDILIKNKTMYERAEREIRKYLDLPEKEITTKPEAQKKESSIGATMADFMKPEVKKQLETGKKIMQFEVAVSRYSSGGLAIFLPALFSGERFSAIYSDGTLLVTRDDEDGLLMTELSTEERCVATFAIGKWFPELKNLPAFNSYKQRVFYEEDESFEIKIFPEALEVMRSRDREDQMLKLAENPKPPVIVVPEPAPEQAAPVQKETKRERAKRYIAWLNEFSANNGYEIKNEGGKLVLERSDRLD